VDPRNLKRKRPVTRKILAAAIVIIARLLYLPEGGRGKRVGILVIIVKIIVNGVLDFMRGNIRRQRRMRLRIFLLLLVWAFAVGIGQVHI
jgi:hypothetical protein